MACTCGGSYQPSDEYGRYNIGAPVRQALLTIRASMIQSKRAANKFKNAFVILSETGIYCFESANPEANSDVLCWVKLDEAEWEQTDMIDHKLKKFALAIKTLLSRIELHFRDFNELDCWKKSINNTQKYGRAKNMKPVVRSQSNSIIQPQDSVVALEEMDSSIKAHAKITLTSITVPNVCELEDNADNVQDLEFFCKLIMGNAVYKTKTVSTSVTDKKRVKSNGRATTFSLADKEDDPDFTFTFDKIGTPNVLIVIVYQIKKGKNKAHVRGVVNLDIECARSSGDVRDSFTPRPAEIDQQPEKSLAVSIIARTRYDAESLRKVTFGAPLNQIMERQVDHKRLMIPDVMYQCLAFLWKHSLKTQGVFRVSGNKNRMRSYVTELDRSATGTLPLMKYEDEHTVAGIMKLYLRELPEPLITFDHYETMLISGGASKDIMKKTNNPLDALNAIKQFASSAATKDLEQPPLDTTLEQLRKLTQELPPSHYLLLKYTCHLLHCITHHSDVNFMKPTNLAIVFGPVFASPSADMDISKQEMLTGHLPYLSRSTEIMIVNWPDVFPNSKGILELIECNNNYDLYQKAKQEGRFNSTTTSTDNDSSQDLEAKESSDTIGHVAETIVE